MTWRISRNGQLKTKCTLIRRRLKRYLLRERGSLRTADVSPRSSPLRDVSRGRTSATQRQKFHTDDVNQCLHNKSGSHGFSNANLFNFTFLLVDFGKVLCSSATELQ